MTIDKKSLPAHDEKRAQKGAGRTVLSVANLCEEVTNMRKHILGMTLFTLIMGTTFYLNPPRPRPYRFHRARACRSEQPAFYRSPLRETGTSVTLAPARHEATVSFMLHWEVSRPAPEKLWVRVEFISPDADAPRWTAGPLPIMAEASPGQPQPVTLNLPYTPDMAVNPRANYYARVSISPTPDAEPQPLNDTTDLVPVLLLADRGCKTGNIISR